MGTVVGSRKSSISQHSFPSSRPSVCSFLLFSKTLSECWRKSYIDALFRIDTDVSALTRSLLEQNRTTVFVAPWGLRPSEPLGC